MALSQLLDDSPLRAEPKPAGVECLYNESHRLALEELLSGGLDCFLGFLRRERLPNFLSDDEIRHLRDAAVSPQGDDPGLEHSLSTSVDCSSVTYFPEVSDVEPPLLELGWPAFTAGSYRGVTRAVAHFQPSYGECIYGCKEAARRMIKSAREVIAIVTDSLTDLDIFEDLREACSHRRVPVYILLDQSSSPAFLKMCRNIGVCLDDLQLMRVRTITGSSYYMRSGVRVTGQVHERFMLIDGIKVATGSYRFNWTDGKVNSSNLVELSGQIAEKFDEEFRILYAQSAPVSSTRCRPPGSRSDSLHAPLLLLKSSLASSPQVRTPAGGLCLTSTPTRRAQPGAEPRLWEAFAPDPAAQEEVLAGSAAQLAPTTAVHASTQTHLPLPQPDLDLDTDRAEPPPPGRLGPAPPEAAVGNSSPALRRERQRHYAVIRAKLEHMVSSLAPGPGLADGPPAAAESQKTCRTHKDALQEANSRLP